MRNSAIAPIVAFFEALTGNQPVDASENRAYFFGVTPSCQAGSMTERHDLDRAVAREMRLHHGLVTRVQARRMGVSEESVDGRVERGIWVVAHAGVYRAAAAPRTDHQDLLAAVWAAGRGALGSRRSAAWIWGFHERTLGAIDVMIPDDRVVRLRGVRIHRCVDAATTCAAERDGIPVTNPLRTLLDLGAVVPWRQVEDAVDRAIASRLVTIDGLRAELDRTARQGVRGAGVLRRVLESRGVQSKRYPPSVLESRMGRLLKPLPLPPPDVELIAGPDGRYRIDYSWPDVLLAAEVEGFGPHSALRSFGRDRLRGNEIRRQGWLHLQYTWRHVTSMRGYVAREIVESYNQQRDLRSILRRDAG
jgi:hypothetical protein